MIYKPIQSEITFKCDDDNVNGIDGTEHKRTTWE